MARDRGYLAPIPFGKNITEICTPEEISSWSSNIISDGKSYLRLQPAYPFIQDGVDLVNGDSAKVRVQSLSSVRTDQTVRNAKELVAAQTNIRIIPAFKSDIPEFRHQTQILNNGFMAWQGMTFADRRLRKAWQYAVCAGTGYVGVRYDPNYYYKGHGDIVCDAYGPLDVLPVGMGRQHDIQKAYAVALRVDTPVHEAWRLFPDYVDQIAPTRSSAMGRGTVISQAVKFATAVLKRFGQGTKTDREPASWEMVDVYYIYVDDDSINDTGHEIIMRGPDKQYDTSWSYKVPFLGQEISAGKDKYRKANRADCLLYPNRRLIVSVENCIVNPDPQTQASPYWHAKVPVSQFRSDDWAWNFLGFPMTRYGQSLEKMSIGLWRGMEDAMNGRLSPTRAYDRTNMSASAAAALNTRIPNQVVGLDFGLLGDNALPKPLLPFQWYEYPPHYLQAQDQLRSMIKDQMGTADTAALARARQLPSGDSQEKLLEALGPLVKDQSRNMEESIRSIGELWKSNFFQFITAARRLQILGPDGLAEEDYDYNPGTLIPDSKALIDAKMNRKWRGEDGEEKQISGQLESRLSGSAFEMYDADSAVPQFERARWHKDNFPFTIVPYSLHEFNSMTRKLMYIQRKKAGFPMDPWTEAEMFDDRNFGDPPLNDFGDGEGLRRARTGFERYQIWLKIQVAMKQAMAGTLGQPGGARSGAGRPSSDQQPPTLEGKANGASTVRTSKHAG